jgi:L-iditol 2-dehydrogenase
MKVARVHSSGQLHLHDEPMPVPGFGEVLVRVTAVGICGSDIHWYKEGGIGGDRIIEPFVLGHECAGVIESGSRAGQRVAIDPAISCGRCEFCEEGNPNLCIALRFAGHAPQDGALRQYMAWPERCLIPIPETLSDIEGVMLEPLGVALYSVNRADVKPGMSVAVFGCGTIGLSVLQVVRAAGAASIYASDLPEISHRMEAARSFGATILPADGREADEILAATDGHEILAATDGRGVDVAFEAAGDPEAVEAAVTAVKPGGQVILIGISREDRTVFTASSARRKDLTIKVIHRMKHTYPRSIQLVQGGQIDVGSLVTHRFSLAAVSRAYAAAEKREGIKIVVEC